MVAASAVTAIGAIRRHDRPRFSWLFAATLALVLAAAVSVPLHAQTADLKELSSSLAYLAFAVTVAWNARDARSIGVLACAVILSALAVAVVAIIEQLFNVYVWRGDIVALNRRNSTLADPNVAGRVLALGLVTLLGLVAGLRAMPRRYAWVALVIAAALGIGEALSQSRTVWIVILVVLVAWLPIGLHRRWMIAVMATFAVAMALSVVALPFLASRAATINAADLEAEYGTALPPGEAMTIGPPTPADPVIAVLPIDGVRRYLIRAGVAIWLDHPLTGVGLGGYDEALLGPYRAYIPPDRRAWPTALLHTDAVRVLAETGLVGFAGWLAFLVAFVVTSARLIAQAGWYRALGMASLSAFAIIFLASQLAGRFATEPYLWLLVGVLLAAQRIAPRITDNSAS